MGFKPLSYRNALASIPRPTERYTFYTLTYKFSQDIYSIPQEHIRMPEVEGFMLDHAFLLSHIYLPYKSHFQIIRA